MSFNRIDWLNEQEHKRAIARSVSIHPGRGEYGVDFKKHNTCRTPTEAVLKRKLAAVSAHVERHPHSTPAQEHLIKLEKRLSM